MNFILNFSWFKRYERSITVPLSDYVKHLFVSPQINCINCYDRVGMDVECWEVCVKVILVSRSFLTEWTCSFELDKGWFVRTRNIA